MSNINSPQSQPKFRLHPLIHTLLEFDLAQHIVSCQGKVAKAEKEAHAPPIIQGENACPGAAMVASWGYMPLEMLATYTFAEVLWMIPKCGENLGKKC